jgi:hemolysin III
MSIKEKHLQDPPATPLEEAISSATHAVGTLLSVIGLIQLVKQAQNYGDRNHVVSFSIYGVSLVLLYASSTLYHGILHPRVRNIFKVMDHSSIYLLIAGTYTPFLLVGFRSRAGWVLFGVIWGLALVGITLKVLFIRRFHRLSVVIYLFMGWLGIVRYEEILATLPREGVIWLAAGGLAYTVGVGFYLLKKIPYMHVVWHFFVLGGSICHYMVVLLYLAPG